MAVLNQILLLKKDQKQTRKATFYHLSHFYQASITRSTVLRPVRLFLQLRSKWSIVFHFQEEKEMPF